MPVLGPALQLDNPAVFPQRYGGSFPPTFGGTVRNILKRLFRVYGHIYHSHFRCGAAASCCLMLGGYAEVLGCTDGRCVGLTAGLLQTVGRHGNAASVPACAACSAGR